MKNLQRYLTVALFSFCMFSFYTAFSKATICEANGDCLVYESVSFNGGLSWVNACCSDFELVSGQTCTDDCRDENGGVIVAPETHKERIGEDHFLSGLAWTEIDELGQEFEYKIELNETGLVLNGEIIAKFSRSVSGVIISSENFSFDLILRKEVNQIQADAMQFVNRELFVSGLEVINTGMGGESFLGVKANWNITELSIYDVQGHLVYQEVPSSPTKELNLFPVYKENVTPGMRILRVTFENGSQEVYKYLEIGN